MGRNSGVFVLSGLTRYTQSIWHFVNSSLHCTEAIANRKRQQHLGQHYFITLECFRVFKDNIITLPWKI